MTGERPYCAMAYNNRWANFRLLSACAHLSQADFVAPRTGFFPSLHATLNRNLVVDLYYVDAMEGGTVGRAAFADREPCRTVAALQAAQAAVDGRLIAVAAAAGGATRPVDLQRVDGIKREPLARVLLHLFQHQVHHRGQAHAMLSGTGVAPPQLDDFFLSQDAPVRADDFRALGWTEALIWPA